MRHNVLIRGRNRHRSPLHFGEAAKSNGSMNERISVSYLRAFIITSTLTSFFLGCGSANTSASLSTEFTKCQTQKTHPNRQYLIEQAEGHTISEARIRASTALTRRLSAEIRSEVSVKTVERSGSQVDDVQESVRVSSHFEHAELIRPLKRCERCIEDACSSAVYLNRDELAARLLTSISPELKRLNEALKDLKPQSELLRFTQAWYLSQASAKKIEPISEQLKLIERSSAELEAAERGIDQARKERAAREERLWIIVDQPKILSEEELPPTLSEGLTGSISRALETLGLKQSSEEQCPVNNTTSDQDYLKLSPRGSLSCTLGLIGPQCQLKLSVNLSLCGAGVLGEDSWSQVKLIGVHTRDQQGAINALLKNLGKTNLSAAMSKSISPFIIL